MNAPSVHIVCSLCRRFAAPLARRSLVLLLVWAGGLSAAEQPAGILAEGTPWATPFFVRDAGRPGPVVLVVGGMHGNEPAGAYAAGQIRHWPIVRGKLVVVPRANEHALLANTRYTPESETPLRNLNRNFARAGKTEPPRGDLATALWKLIEEQRPLWLLDLHEGYDFNRINPDSVGSTLIVHPSPDADEAAERMLEAINATISDEQKRFRRRGPPIDSSLARAAGEHLNIRAMILETTSKAQPLSYRARQHRLMVHCLLTHLNMLDPAVTVELLTDPHASAAETQVALYDAGGSSGRGVPRVMDQLGREPDVEVVRVGPEEIRGGALEQFEVVIFSGGSGSRQAAALGEDGRLRVREFIEQGGGYLGICAGSYLACDGFSWGLKILDARTVSPKWQRGQGLVTMELTKTGREIFGPRSGPVQVRYHNGPILTANQSGSLPDYEPLAVFRTELAENGAPKGVMVDSPAIVAGACGQGRVLCISPHPEQTEGLEHFLPRAIQWISAGDNPSSVEPPNIKKP